MRANEFITESTVDEMALAKYQTMGDFGKPGPFRGVDKRLVPHPKTQMKAQKFFENTPYDFRLFFSNIPGTGKFSEYGPMSPEEIQKNFGDQAPSIIDGHEDAITVVFVGNKGDSKVMLTPWMMAHRFGHSVLAGARFERGGFTAWPEAEKHFFKSINSMLAEYYGKAPGSKEGMSNDLTPAYNALFNAIGTQKSSRSGQIKRPYEFLHETLAQYLGTGHVTFNALPSNLGYGSEAWGNPSKYLNIKPEYRDEQSRKDKAEKLARDMEYKFSDVISSSVGKIFVM